MTTAATTPAEASADQTERSEASLWQPMVRAMGKTGGASIASGLLSVVGTKIIALLLGPGSVALLQTLQQLRDFALTAATANGRTALLQGASSLDGVERREYLRTVALLFAAGTLLVVLGMVAVAPAETVRWSRLPASMQPLLPWLAGTIALLSVFVFLSAILNAFREYGKLALLQLASPAVAAVVAWPLARAERSGHPVALVLFLAIPAAATVVAAALAVSGLRRQLQAWFRGPGRWWSKDAARGFLMLSGAMLASGMISTTVLLAVRGFIARREGLAMTGQFDAAWNISMNQVTLILGSVQTYYLPSLAAAKSAGERGRQIRSMLLVATLATVPAIVTLAALKPLVVSLLYSHAFSGSPGFLRWTLLGDYLKVGAWVLATPMLATRDVKAFFILDLFTHATFFISAAGLMRLFEPAESAAIGFLISYALYFALCYAYARSRHGFRFGGLASSAWLTGLLLVAGVSASTWTDPSILIAKDGVWILLAFLFTIGYAMRLRRRPA